MNMLINMKVIIKWIYEFDMEVVWILFFGNVWKDLIFKCVVW